MRWCWVNFQCRGVLLIWIRVGQGPIALAVGAAGGCLDIFLSPLSFLSSFSLSLGDGPISTEILSQRAAKTKTTNQQSLNRAIPNNNPTPPKHTNQILYLLNYSGVFPIR